MLAKVVLRTSIGSRRRSVPFQLQQKERLRLVPPMSKELEGGQPPFVNTLPRDQTQPHLEVVHGLRHQRIALRPVVAPAGDQPDAYRIAPGQQPETVVLDLVNPVGAGRGLAGWGWEAGSMKLARSAGTSAYAYARSTYR